MAGIAGSKTLMFRGKKYTLFDWAANKREAMREARELRREDGRHVHLTKADEGYHIWVR